MEPTSILLVLSIPALIAGVALLVNRKKETRSDIVDRARERSKKRIIDRGFADTTPDVHSHNGTVDFVTVNGVTVLEDGVNSHGIALSDEQMRTIGLIFQGYTIPAQHRPVHTRGPDVHIASGVPLNLSALADCNRIEEAPKTEYLDPNYTWPGTHTRG